MRLAAMSLLLASACSAGVADQGGDGETSAELRVPGLVRVGGHVVDVEKTYLPRVVQCENPDAPYESLKAQAVAARTYLTYRSDGKAIPTIEDGQSDQVYTCANNHQGAYVAADVMRAVLETRSEVVLWNGKITAGFFVAGASRSKATCRSLSDPTNTEGYVTYNFGLINSESNRSKIGDHSTTNRGCMAQRLANCLADSGEYEYQSLLRYFYGSDAQVAPIGSELPSLNDILKLAAEDHLQVLCWSDTLGRPVARGACVQSASNHIWYQCDDDSQFKVASVDASGGSGPVGACTKTLGL
jgi:hypothetical protein